MRWHAPSEEQWRPAEPAPFSSVSVVAGASEDGAAVLVAPNGEPLQLPKPERPRIGFLPWGGAPIRTEAR